MPEVPAAELTCGTEGLRVAREAGGKPCVLWSPATCPGGSEAQAPTRKVLGGEVRGWRGGPGTVPVSWWGLGEPGGLLGAEGTRSIPSRPL